MKCSWIALVLCACTVRVSGPFRAPPAGPDSEAAPQSTSGPTPRYIPGSAPPATDQNSSAPTPRYIPGSAPPPAEQAEDAPRAPDPGVRTQVVAAHYDTLIDELAEADRDASAHKQDQAAESYEAAVKQADQLLAEVGSRPSPSVSYPTRTEGPLHETALVAKVREQRARALRLAKAAHERSAASARDDLHMKTAGQRAVFAEHGMPRQVRHQRAQTCWYYFSSRAQEVFCWNASGQSTKRKTDAPLRSVSAGWSDALPYDSTATFASGDCKDGGCGRAGWTEHFDGGLGADTDCNAGNCLKHGWTTRFSDGVMATTRCNGGDCSRKGWTTRFSDGGDDAKTECDGGDCLKYGWTTWLRMGYSLDCDCGGVCLTEGANCAH